MEGTVLLKLRPLLERLFCVVGHVGWLWRGNVFFFLVCQRYGYVFQYYGGWFQTTKCNKTYVGKNREKHMNNEKILVGYFFFWIILPNNVGTIKGSLLSNQYNGK